MIAFGGISPAGAPPQQLFAEEIQTVMTKLNSRPRKSLAFKSSNQLCFGHHAIHGTSKLNPPIEAFIKFF
ncbi:MAG: hypothetical protein O7F12_16460 [Nitrospirae bacterium]|nr:hypothetical protein [Nitrospirota bacterium]